MVNHKRRLANRLQNFGIVVILLNVSDAVSTIYGIEIGHHPESGLVLGYLFHYVTVTQFLLAFAIIKAISMIVVVLFVAYAQSLMKSEDYRWIYRAGMTGLVIASLFLLALSAGNTWLILRQ